MSQLSHLHDPLPSKRLMRELNTISAMVEIYCQAHHDTTIIPCEECRQLLIYARKRLLGCVFQEQKPTCSKCPIHCYKSNSREKVKEVMRYSGPRMIFRHPIMAIRHLFDGHRTPPQQITKQNN